MNRNARRVAATVVVMLAAASAGCGNKQAGDEAKDVDAKSTTSTSADDSTTTTAAGGDAPSTTVAPAASGKSGTATTAAAKASGSGAGSSSATTTAAAGGSSGGGSASAVGAKPGTYTFDVSGTRSGGTPPTTAQMNAKATNVVDAASGTTQHSTQRSDSSGGGGGQELVLEYRADGVYLQNLKITGQVSKEFKADPPVLATPIPVPAGKQWSWDLTSTDGSTTIHADNKGAGTETITIGGQSVETDKVEIVMTIKTTFNGAPITVTVTSTRWQSPKYSLTVKTHDVTDVPGFGHSDTTAVLESVNPA